MCSIVKRAYARLGLLGNPSDGFYGKTISVTIRTFYAEVELVPSEKLVCEPHAVHDVVQSDSLNELSERINLNGYNGGHRLLLATCRRFQRYCHEQGIHLHSHNFTLRYNTTIPRQVGLAGSSAIIVSAFRCLMKFYGVDEASLPRTILPHLVMTTETEELGLAAGLQDRVVQVYEGLVAMNFDEEHMAQHGHGIYECLDPSILPRMWLAYVTKNSDSGKVHSTVKQRWLNGDPEVREAMRTWASLAEEGRAALQEHDYETFGKCMCKNFHLRRRIYSDEVIGSQCLAMVAIADRCGAPAKFPGSGGAVIGTYTSHEQFTLLEQEFRKAGGFNFMPVEYYSPTTCSSQ